MKYDVKKYWETRYASGNDSGFGSHNERSVTMKSDYVNNVIQKYNVKTIYELGCGDGNQLKYFKGYEKYYGYDISPTTVLNCMKLYANDKSKIFDIDKPNQLNIKYDMGLSLDVIYHLVDDEMFTKYMDDLFSLSDVICLFTTDHDFYDPSNSTHIRHRHVTKYVEENKPKYKLVDKLRYYELGTNDNDVSFFLYVKE